MKAIDVIRNALQFSDHFTSQFLEDVRDMPLTQPTPRGGNHPLWIVGHLACSEEGIRSMITGESRTLEHWDKQFNPRTQPTTNPADYPPYDEVLGAYRDQRARTMHLLNELDDSDLDKTLKGVPDEMRDLVRTNADVFTIIIAHHGHHMGQLADARRAAGREPLIA